MFINGKEREIMKDLHKKSWKGILLSPALAFLLSGVLTFVGTVRVQAAEPTVNKKTQTMNVGQQVTLQVKNAGKKITWSSSNNSVIKIVETGGSKIIRCRCWELLRERQRLPERSEMLRYRQRLQSSMYTSTAMRPAIRQRPASAPDAGIQRKEWRICRHRSALKY